MMHAAPWASPAHTARWPAPPSDNSLLTLQLVGDLHLNPPGVTYPDPQELTAYDALGRDMRDRITAAPPARIIQMGDLAGGISHTYNEVVSRFSLFNTWLGDYGLDAIADWDLVIGNHDTPGAAGEPRLVTPSQWAAYFGYPAASYVIDDLGPVRVIVVGPSGLQGDPPSTGSFPVRPMTTGDINWLDDRLSEDTRPTLIATHAPMDGMAGVIADDWKNVTSSESGGKSANDLKAVLNAHSHCIGWVHGHTHSKWNNDRNTSTFNVGSRRIAVVDASATMTKAEDFGGETIMPTTFYLSILDDAKTVDVRWRTHDQATWDGIGQARYHRLVAT